MKETKPIRDIVLQRLALLGQELGKPELAAVSDETHLIGGKSSLDSIGLVTLIADLEGDIQREYGVTVTLADEKAMSLTVSPFRKAGTLVTYIEEKLGTKNEERKTKSGE
jgi:acyl carrier protein